MNIFKVIVLFNCLSASLPLCSGYDTESIAQMISVIIQNEKVPSVLSAITCWSTAQNFEFVKRSNISTQVNSQFKLSPRVSNDLTNKLWYFIDMRCDKSEKFLHDIEEEYFAHPYRWILFEPNIERLNNLTFLTDSNVLLIQSNGKKGQFDLNQSEFYI